jgi:hypothetical protein
MALKAVANANVSVAGLKMPRGTDALGLLNDKFDCNDPR